MAPDTEAPPIPRRPAPPPPGALAGNVSGLSWNARLFWRRVIQRADRLNQLLDLHAALEERLEEILWRRRQRALLPSAPPQEEPYEQQALFNPPTVHSNVLTFDSGAGLATSPLAGTAPRNPPSVLSVARLIDASGSVFLSAEGGVTIHLPPRSRSVTPPEPIEPDAESAPERVSVEESPQEDEAEATNLRPSILWIILRALAQPRNLQILFRLVVYALKRGGPSAAALIPVLALLYRQLGGEEEPEPVSDQ